jgi:signal transduction histidine kinase
MVKKLKKNTAANEAVGGTEGKPGVLVQDLGQLQRTCHSLEQQLVQAKLKLKESKDLLEKERGNKDQQLSNELLDAIRQAQSQYISDRNPDVIFDNLHSKMLHLTQSEFGFIGEILHTADNRPYLKTHAVSNIAWNEATRTFYQHHVQLGMEFHNMDTLFRQAILTNEPVISNNPAEDPRSTGTPAGHPPLQSFMGIPFFDGKELIGMVGIANRPGGYDEKLIDYLQPFTATCSNIIAAYRNQNQRKQAEDEVTRYQDRLIRSKKLSAIGRLSASIAHEFNNPIYGIRNVLEKIRESTLLDRQNTDFVDLALEECDRVQDLMQKLMDFYRPSAHKKEFIEVHSILDETLRLIENSLRKKKIKLKRNYEMGLPKVVAVKGQIRQVLLNLLQNAEEAIVGCAGTISISTESHPQALEIRFKDNGIGIPRENIDQIFDPFFTTKTSAKETGLGLSISYSIINAHGGDIEIISSTDEGTEVIVTLPKQGDQP